MSSRGCSHAPALNVRVFDHNTQISIINEIDTTTAILVFVNQASLGESETQGRLMAGNSGVRPIRGKYPTIKFETNYGHSSGIDICTSVSLLKRNEDKVMLASTVEMS
jgi:hypothetical protein